MGCQVDVYSSSHSKDELIKKLGGENIYIWTQGEHLKLKHHYDAILNTLPVPINKEQLKGLISTVKPYGKWL